jgi:hypothetical protein
MLPNIVYNNNPMQVYWKVDDANSLLVGYVQRAGTFLVVPLNNPNSYEQFKIAEQGWLYYHPTTRDFGLFPAQGKLALLVDLSGDPFAMDQVITVDYRPGHPHTFSFNDMPNSRWFLHNGGLEGVSQVL